MTRIRTVAIITALVALCIGMMCIIGVLSSSVDESPNMAIPDSTQMPTNTPVMPTDTPQPTTTPCPCACGADEYNCGDPCADECFITCGGVDNDIHQLDGDNNGIPCEEY